MDESLGRGHNESNRMLMKLNEGEQRVFLICIRFGSCEVRRLTRALDSQVKNVSCAHNRANTIQQQKLCFGSVAVPLSAFSFAVVVTMVTNMYLLLYTYSILTLSYMRTPVSENRLDFFFVRQTPACFNTARSALSAP